MEENANPDQRKSDVEQQSVPSIGELERSIAQRIVSLYDQLTGQQPTRVNCHFFANNVSILIEGSVAPVEALLLKAGQFDLAGQVRPHINLAIRQQIKSIFASEFSIDVQEILIDSVFESGYTSLLAILANVPKVRNPENIPKTGASRRLKKIKSGDRDRAAQSSKPKSLADDATG